MDARILTPLVSALLSGAISAAVSFLVCTRTLRSQERARLHDLINKVNDIAIRYPYLEDDYFCTTWKDMNKKDESAMRYENYCCQVFNLLERLWDFHGGNEQEMHKMFWAPEMIRRHQAWWKRDHHNISGYGYEFRQYIHKYVPHEKPNQ